MNTTQLKKNGDYENIYSVNPLYLITGEVDGDIEKKMGLNILLSILQIKTSKYLKKTENFVMGLYMVVKRVNMERVHEN